MFYSFLRMHVPYFFSIVFFMIFASSGEAQIPAQSPREKACATTGVCVALEPSVPINSIRVCHEVVTESRCKELETDIEKFNSNDASSIAPTFIFAPRTTCEQWRSAEKAAQISQSLIQAPPAVSVEEFCKGDALNSEGTIETMTLEILNDIWQPYTCFHDCTHYSKDFHEECELRGLNCKTATISCQGTYGHQMNLVSSAKHWLLVEPQNRIVASVSLPLSASDSRSICNHMRVPLDSAGNCPCTLGTNDRPIPSNGSPDLWCAAKIEEAASKLTEVWPFAKSLLAEHFLGDCLACCHEKPRYFISKDVPGINEWWKQCSSACFSRLSPGKETYLGYQKGDDLASSLGTHCAYPLADRVFVSQLFHPRQTTVDMVNFACKDCCEQHEKQGRLPHVSAQWCVEVCKGSVQY